MDQGSNKNHSPAYNFTPAVTKFCVMWEGLSLPHDTKFGNCRCKIVDSRSFHSWSLIHGLRWSGLIKVGPGSTLVQLMVCWLMAPSHHLNQCCNIICRISDIHPRAFSHDSYQPSITKNSSKFIHLTFLSNLPWTNEFKHFVRRAITPVFISTLHQCHHLSLFQNLHLYTGAITSPSTYLKVWKQTNGIHIYLHMLFCHPNISVRISIHRCYHNNLQNPRKFQHVLLARSIMQPFFCVVTEISMGSFIWYICILTVNKWINRYMLQVLEILSWDTFDYKN